MNCQALWQGVNMSTLQAEEVEPKICFWRERTKCFNYIEKGKKTFWIEKFNKKN